MTRTIGMIPRYLFESTNNSYIHLKEVHGKI
jgi:hypothetical protein